MPHDETGFPPPKDNVAADQYKKFQQVTTYGYDPGVFVLPLASRTPKTITVRAHAGVGTRTVEFDAVKNGSPPIIPSAADTDRDVLVQAGVSIPLPAPSGHDSGFDWVVKGVYVFVTKGVEDVLDEDGEVTGTKNGPRVPGSDYLNAGQYPFTLAIQDAAGRALAPSGDIRGPGDELPAQIEDNSFLWPYTVFPPAFFNGDLLRDDHNGLADPLDEETP
jgi:hypothetical protein